MKRNSLHFTLATALLIALQISLFSQEKLKVAVIPKSNTAMFWKSVHSGVRLGGVALGGVEILWKASQKENDIEQQIIIIEECISENVSGIILAPLDKDALAGSVAKAAKKKIPVLIYDSALKGTPGKDFICYVGIDNKKAGSVAGEQLAKMLGGRGKVVILRYMVSQSNISNREEGFLETIAKYEGMQVIEKNHYVSGTIEEAMEECMKMADKLKEADGVFCSYEQSTMGMLLALRKLNLAGKIKFIGFDTPALAVIALKKGEISALVAQDPARMGYFCVKTMVDYLRDKKIQPKIDVDVRIITRDNINDPEIQKVLALPSMSD